MTCVLDDWQLRNRSPLRRTEPCQSSPGARLAKTAGDYRWSTARAHLGLETLPEWLDTDPFLRRWPTPASWRDRLATLTRCEVAAVRRATRLDSSPGSGDFLRNLECTWQIRFRALPTDWPRKGPATETPLPVPAIQSATA